MKLYSRTWRGTIVISVANPLLFLLGIGVGIGHLVDPGESTALGGVPYADFFAPGCWPHRRCRPRSSSAAGA